ncbi:MAG: hypothetical protein K0S65_6052 [Labilithrix sp.]|nr:hypothetical protein [Labilithrix sp.]
MKPAVSVGSTLTVLTRAAFESQSAANEWTLLDVFVAESIETMCWSDGIASRNAFVFSAIASVATMRTLASQSLMMKSQSFGS